MRANCPCCILLAVHGVRAPGEEITEQLRSVLQRRLNSCTLEAIQNALLKNAHIRLECSDIQVCIDQCVIGHLSDQYTIC